MNKALILSAAVVAIILGQAAVNSLKKDSSADIKKNNQKSPMSKTGKSEVGNTLVINIHEHKKNNVNKNETPVSKNSLTTNVSDDSGSSGKSSQTENSESKSTSSSSTSVTSIENSSRWTETEKSSVHFAASPLIQFLDLGLKDFTGDKETYSGIYVFFNANLPKYGELREGFTLLWTVRLKKNSQLVELKKAVQYESTQKGLNRAVIFFNPDKIKDFTGASVKVEFIYKQKTVASGKGGAYFNPENSPLVSNGLLTLGETELELSDNYNPVAE